MTIEFNRLVFGPGLCVIGAKLMLQSGIDRAIEMMGLEDIAEKDGTPLNDLIGRTANRPHGGQGDDLAEFAGRQCYRSWGKGRGHAEYIENIVGMRHGSVFAHSDLTFQVIGVSRSLSLELVRHHVGTNISQESQRYVDAKDLRFVVPPLIVAEYETRRVAALAGDIDDPLDFPAMNIFRRGCQASLEAYIEMQPHLETLAREAQAAAQVGDIKSATNATKRANEAARSVLPNAAETRFVWTCNLRAMRWILAQRGSEGADLEIRRFAIALQDEARGYAPEFFKAATQTTGADGLPTLDMGVDHL